MDCSSPQVCVGKAGTLLLVDVFLDDGDVRVLAGDCVRVMAGMDAGSVDAVVCDPPYALEFMGRGWDKFTPTGFQTWCSEWGAQALRVLKPGGHLLAFGGTRTFHRLTAGLEDAGFEIRDCLSWLYGSGFPKSLDVSKAIDKRPGVTRHAAFAAHLAARRQTAGLSRADVSERVVGSRTGACWNWEHHQFPEAKWWPALRDLLGLDDEWAAVIAEAERAKVGAVNGSRLAVAPGQGEDRARVDLDVTAPATDAAREWEGWGTALKPAWEPIVLARKPLQGTVAHNVQQHGTGALNIDGCRVGTDPGYSYPNGAGESTFGIGKGNDGSRTAPASSNPAGRWPANVVLDEAAAQALDAPSRFFYTAKASRRERTAGGRVENTHPTVKPVELMRWLVRLVCPPGGVVLDPFAGSGTTGVACRAEGVRCVLVEREAEYLPIIAGRLTELSLGV